MTFPFSINTTLNMRTWMILPLDYSTRFLFGGLFVLISFSKEVRGWESRFPRRKTETAFKGQWHMERREMNITQLWPWLRESSYRALSQFQRFPLSGLHHRLLTLYRNDFSVCARLRCYGIRMEILYETYCRTWSQGTDGQVDSLLKLIKSGNRTRPDSRRHTC